MLLVINRSITEPFNSLFSGNMGLSPYFVMPKLSRAFPSMLKVLKEPAFFFLKLPTRMSYIFDKLSEYLVKD